MNVPSFIVVRGGLGAAVVGFGWPGAVVFPVVGAVVVPVDAPGMPEATGCGAAEESGGAEPLGVTPGGGSLAAGFIA
ncbi:hypothetical protein GCM10010399_29920 [Dactylosporangium fulvum]